MKNKNQNLIIKMSISIALSLVVLASATPVFASNITPENIAYLVNQERSFYGLNPLTIDRSLDNAATLKSKDMINRHYFEHYAMGLTPWDFITNSDYNYLYAGENLAMDFKTSEGVVNAWLASPEHRANILNPDYEDMGLGVVKGAYVENNQSRDTIMVTNMFGRKKTAIVEVFNAVIENISLLFKF